ncbi:MAG: hypothetical protein LUH11_01300 [Candidatus Gastranaerophilales bacterium]|nr:hypothetical protein [Candidatus Gastranaerophilales bacterium]
MNITIASNIPFKYKSNQALNYNSGSSPQSKYPLINVVTHSNPSLQPHTGSAIQVKDFNSDLFISAKSNKSYPLAFSGRNVFNSPKTTKQKQTDYTKAEAPNEFSRDISNGIKRVMECDIPPENFSFVMTPDEFRQLLPELKEKNFISSKENQETGIYNTDLDYQSTFSSGNESVFFILDAAAKYADDYYNRTGKKFIFSLTDRDSIEGLQHLLRVAGSNPEKYKHLKILPGLKMSFAHKAPNSTIGYENSDMLIYGINPFSQNVMDFIDTTIYKRKNMITSFINEVNQLYPEFSYTVEEFDLQNRIKYHKSFGVPNLYWRVREYAETKGDIDMKSISMTPDQINQDVQAIMDNLGIVLLGSDLNKYSGIDSQIIKDNDVNKSIKQVFDKYSTHYDKDKGKAISSAENLYKDMIDCLSREKEKPVLALASPYYFSHYYEEQNSGTFNKTVDFFKELASTSNGMLLAFESVVPFYDLDKFLKPETIETFNNFIRENTDLYEVGGSFAKRN